MKSELVKKSARFAAVAHAGQKRKFTGEPYIVHPARVYRTLLRWGMPDEILAAAWLHDTVEDTYITIQDIYTVFGSEVADIVYGVTNLETNKSLSRDYRVMENISHISYYSKRVEGVSEIKLADMLDNVPSMVQYRPLHARAYIDEKYALLYSIRRTPQWQYTKDLLDMQSQFLNNSL